MVQLVLTIGLCVQDKEVGKALQALVLPFAVLSACVGFGFFAWGAKNFAAVFTPQRHSQSRER
jgi:hypothetical protein